MKKKKERKKIYFFKVSKIILLLQSIAEARGALGFVPKYPIIIIPGLACTALESWNRDKSSFLFFSLFYSFLSSPSLPHFFHQLILFFTKIVGWQRERVWVDPFKIGKAAVFQKVANKFSRKKKEKKVELLF